MRATKVPRGVVLLYASAFLMAYEQVISFDNLYKGLKESCRNIRWKDSTVGYEGNALKNTYRLRQTLLNGTYRGDTYHERLKMINYFKNMEATYNAREYL